MAVTKPKRGQRKPEKKTTHKSNPTVELTTSGADMLDLALGGEPGKAVPWGKIINIIGDKSTGKTLLTCELIAEAYKRYGKKLHWFYDDTEAGFSFDAEQIWDLDILKDSAEDSSETVEDLISSVKKKLKPYLNSKEYFIYVIDSLDGLTDEAEIKHADNREKARDDNTKAKGSYGAAKAKLLSEFFRLTKNDIGDSNCLLIVISQIRDSLAKYGKKTSRSGGRALDFYASQVIELKEVEKIKPTINKQTRAVGVTIHAYVSKNKIGMPFRECEFKILFDYGVDNIDSNLCFLFELITDTGKTKKKVDVKWDGKTFTDRIDLISYIEENDQETLLLEKVKEKWYEIEDSFKPQRKKK